METKNLLTADSAAVLSFVSALKAKIEAGYNSGDSAYPAGTPKWLAEVEIMTGPKYLRVTVATALGREPEGASRSAYAFIDRQTGDLFKPGGWKGPAKGVRSNINSADFGLSACGVYGVATLR